MTDATAPAISAESGLVVHIKLPLLLQAEQPEWVWVEMLRIPAKDFETIERIASGTPWRWIWFACGVILGTTLGTLSGTSDAPDAHFDYEALGIARDAVYFHVPEEARNNLSTVEPGLCSNRTSSVLAQLRDEYDEEILARDRQCVCTGMPAVCCDTAHLIPHFKGDEYIDFLTKGVITDIDDVRNIILLQANLHKVFGKQFAIMPKPNFAYPAPVGASPDPQTWEPHFLSPFPMAFLSGCRVPENRTEWPPELLFNQVYASAVLHTFACPQNTREALRKLSNRYFGERGPMTRAERSKYELDKAEEAAKKKIDAQTAERDPRDRDTQEIESGLPLWSVLLPDEMRRAWRDNILRQREEAARAASNARVTQWLLP